MRPTIVAAILGAGLLASQSAISQKPNGVMASSANINTAKLPKSLQQMRTVCFGRFLIDVPHDAQVVFGRQDADVPVEYIDNGEVAAELLINNQLAKLEEKRYLIQSRKDDLPRYGTTMAGALPGQRIVFGSRDYDTYSITSFIPKTPHLFVLEFLSTDNFAADMAVMDRVAKHLRLRPADEIPKEPGLCIEGGFVALEAEYENFSMGVRLRDHPDVHFSLTTIMHREYLPSSSMIEERIRQAESMATSSELLWHKRIKYLRRGRKTLGIWRGEEVAARLPSQTGMTESHQFAFVSLGQLNNPYQPHIDIELVSGVKKNARGSVKPSLSDSQMLLLWDALINSIRVRPTRP